MNRATRGMGLALLVLLHTGCGDQGPEGPLTYARLQGPVWILLSLVFTSDANPATTFDFSAQGGSGSLRFEADTTFLLILVPNPGSPSRSSVGPVAIEGDTVVLTDNADPDLPLLSGTLEGTRLVLETDDAEYDFNGDGTDEPAHVSAVFEP
jgi:hypothetical protein